MVMDGLSRGNHARLLARGTLPVLTLPGTEILLRSHMMQTSIFVERHEYRYCTPTV